MLRSMTGFGRGESQENGREFLVEIKTVNHRYCDVFVKMPRQLSFMEDKVRETAARTLSRGKIDVCVSFEDHSDESNCIQLDEGLAGTYVRALGTLRDRFGLKDDISVSLISKFPDVLKIERVEADEDTMWQLLKQALDTALIRWFQ